MSNQQLKIKARQIKIKSQTLCWVVEDDVL